MTPRRLIANAATAVLLLALVVLVIFAWLSTRVVPERRNVMVQMDFKPGAGR